MDTDEVNTSHKYNFLLKMSLVEGATARTLFQVVNQGLLWQKNIFKYEELYM